MIHSNKGPGIETFTFKHSSDVRRRVVLLDCIALLLAYEKGDAVATGLRYESNQYTVVWSGHRPYDSEDREKGKAYLENLAARLGI